MEKKSNFFLLLIIIAVQTLVVAALAVFILVVGVAPARVEAEADAAATDAPPQENVQIALPPPDEADLGSLSLFGDNTYFNLKSDGVNKNPVIIVNVSAKYFKKIEGIKNVDEKMTLNLPNLREIVGTYFQNKTLEEIKDAATRTQAKEDLKKEMNDFLLSTIDKEKDRRKVTAILYEVVFAGWNYQ